MKSRFQKPDKLLVGYLIGAAATWILTGVTLKRNSFIIAGGQSFDWRGFIFTIITVSLAIGVFRLLKSRQRELRYHYALYGALWLIPLIILSTAFQTSVHQINSYQNDTTISSVDNSCSARFLPRVCTYYSAKADTERDAANFAPNGVAFQAGYLASTVMLAVVGYSLYRFLKKRIKSYRHDELFQ